MPIIDYLENVLKTGKNTLERTSVNRQFLVDFPDHPQNLSPMLLREYRSRPQRTERNNSIAWMLVKERAAAIYYHWFFSRQCDILQGV